MSMKEKPNNQTASDIKTRKEQLKRKRRSRRNQVRESFNCQCGKTYLSFSALYLHAKIKHKIKLTTQEKSQICQVEKACGFSQYTYAVYQANGAQFQKESQQPDQDKKVNSSSRKNSQQIEENSTANSDYPSCFNEYLESSGSIEAKKIILQFLRYAFGETKQSQDEMEKRIYELPYLLNPFVLEHMPYYHRFSVDTKKGRKICGILSGLCTWMNETKMTDLRVFLQL